MLLIYEGDQRFGYRVNMLGKTLTIKRNCKFARFSACVDWDRRGRTAAFSLRYANIHPDVQETAVNSRIECVEFISG